MTFYITVLRALAALIITNSHYTQVYPTDLIANGGLLGDVIFFAVSGFCLTNIRYSFFSWYRKRIFRIYPAVWIITGTYLVIGWYSFDAWSIFSYFMYPTYYHFVASIIVLYIPFYFVVSFNYLRTHIRLCMLLVFLAQILVYLFAYDKSYYHIDVVREPMVRFLFMESGLDLM